MTNKIMQNNTLYNINNNKILQDKLSTQMATQKKLTRPSDDPVIAIRALRLRTSVSELTQFSEKNAKDAEAWLTVTEDALSTVNDVITKMIEQGNKGANKDLEGEQLSIIMEQLKSLRDETYATANVDYAGRYIFTGFRTDTTLSFNDEVESKDLEYSITEQVGINSFDSINYTDQAGVEGLNKGNYAGFTGADNTPNETIEEQDVNNGDIHRLRLSYDDLMDGTVPTLTYMDNAGAEVSLTAASTPVSSTASPDPYQTIMTMNGAGVSGSVYVPETGEILFSDAAYNAIVGTVTTGTEIRVTYSKDEWKEGDLRPEHYFACTSEEIMPDGTSKTIHYNQNLDASGAPRVPKEPINPNGQKIEYDVGYNQTIVINTSAADVFTHAMDRNMDDLDRAVIELRAIETTVNDMKGVLGTLSAGTADYELVRKQLDAATKAGDHIRENVHRMFEGVVTKMQNALDDINVAVTDSGTRSARLDMIGNRLLSQKTTFETLKSENEDASISDVAIKLTSTELSYNAALMASGKIMQTSLINYI
jgi:flagellar hook-associated protein 3 FlgL